jgi:NagD protein
MMTLALGILGTDMMNTAIVGDALDIDIKAGKKANLYSILVLTGVTQRRELENNSSQPNLVLNSIQDLMEYI